jgi:ribosomal protein L7Ae-like RNA K-turn-binding protein
MNDRVLSFLGICRRAKKLVIGAEVTEESVRCGKSRLVLHAADASPNSLKRVRRAAQEQNVPVLCAGSGKEELSHALGRLCAVLSVEDEGFAKKLREMID